MRKFMSGTAFLIIVTIIGFGVFGLILMLVNLPAYTLPYSLGARNITFHSSFALNSEPSIAINNKDEPIIQKNEIEKTETVAENTDRAKYTELSEIPQGSYPIKSLMLKPSQYLTGIDGVYIINEDNKSYDLKSLLDNPLDLNIEKEGPQVLIVHTHATESYNENRSNYYFKNEEYRSEDNLKNMISIGKIVASELEKSGIKVIQSENQHDNPSYNKSYTNSNRTIREYLEKYPTIKVVLDIHRDTLIVDKDVKYRTITNIDGKDVAQVMLLMGGGNEKYPNEYWLNNMSLAVKLQKNAAEKYPGFMRPILLRDSCYNQELKSGSMLIEVGTCGNTHEEAELAAKYFSEILIKTIS